MTNPPLWASENELRLLPDAVESLLRRGIGINERSGSTVPWNRCSTAAVSNSADIGEKALKPRQYVQSKLCREILEVFALRAFMAYKSVVRTRAPEAPIGWPRAMAPTQDRGASTRPWGEAPWRWVNSA